MEPYIISGSAVVRKYLADYNFSSLPLQYEVKWFEVVAYMQCVSLKNNNAK